MILVTGATGHLGKATIEFLIQKGISPTEISALVRDESKAGDLKEKGLTIKIGDYDNYASLIVALKGVDKLLLVSATDVINRGKQQINVVNAAKEVGVKHIFYTSFERKNDTETSPMAVFAKPHFETEEVILASGLTYTIFKNNLYLDVLPLFFGDSVMETGVFFPAGETKSAFALRNDMAEATANTLITEGHENKTYLFSNTENISIRDITGIIAEISGKDILYTSPTAEIYVDTLAKAGMPAEYIKMFAAFAGAIKQGEFASAETDFEKLLGRKPTSAREFLSQVYAMKN